MRILIRLAGLLYLCLLLVACAREQNGVAQSDTAASARQCVTPGLSGDLSRFRPSHVRRAALRVEAAGDWDGYQGAAVAIQPICESHIKEPPTLGQGHFVARIMFVDTPTPYSDLTTDIVYWWVFERDGSLVSQFFSMSGSGEEEAIKEFTLVECDGSEPPNEIAGWHSGICHTTDSLGADGRPLRGDNPWFGCTRGCCYSVAPLG